MPWCVSPWVYPVWTCLVSWTRMAISFTILGNFSTIVSSSISHDLSYCVLLGLLWFECWGIWYCPRGLWSCPHFFYLFIFSFLLSASFISIILSSTSLILSSASVILLFVPSRVFFYLIYCIIHYILTLFYLF